MSGLLEEEAEGEAKGGAGMGEHAKSPVLPMAWGYLGSPFKVEGTSSNLVLLSPKKSWVDHKSHKPRQGFDPLGIFPAFFKGFCNKREMECSGKQA